VWIYGHEPRYGLAQVDYKTLVRKVQPSAYWYWDFIQSHPEMGLEKIFAGVAELPSRPKT